MKSLAKITLVFGLIAAFTALSACNTFEGVGKDMKSGGESLENAAERNK